MSRTIAVFGGYRTPPGSVAFGDAHALGRMLAEAGYAVLNGGYGGSMEAVGLGAKEGGGHVIGVTVSYYGPAHDYVDVAVPTADFWQRTRHMIEASDGFAALPGSTGTLAELACAMEMIHKRHVPAKPLVLIGEVWRPVADTVCPAAADMPWLGLAEGPATAVRFLDEFFARAATA